MPSFSCNTPPQLSYLDSNIIENKENSENNRQERKKLFDIERKLINKQNELIIDRVNNIIAPDVGIYSSTSGNQSNKFILTNSIDCLNQIQNEIASDSKKQLSIYTPYPTSSSTTHKSSTNETPTMGTSSSLTLPLMLWQGGYLFKIPYNSKGGPQRRIIALKRRSSKGSKSKRITIISPSGEVISSSVSTTPNTTA